MRKFPTAFLFAFSLLCLGARADTITLKDGTAIEGTITDQNDTQITVTYKVSDSITDTKIIQRADIAKIEKPTEDSLAFDDIKNLKPNSWVMLPPDTYTADIAAIKGFIEKYPQSSHLAEAQALLDALRTEQEHQQAGDVKLYGQWIPKAEVGQRTMQIGAQSLYLAMQGAAGQGDTIGALNMCDQIEKRYMGSRVYPMTMELEKKLESSLEVNVFNAMDDLKVKDAEWKQGVDITPEPQRSQMIAARQAEIAQADAALDLAQKSQQKWPPFYRNDQKSLDAIKAVIDSDKDHLAGLPLDKWEASVQQSDRAAELLASGDVAGAQTLLRSATNLWPPNDEALYMLKRIADAQRPGAVPLKTPAPTPKPRPVVAASMTPAPTQKPKPAFTPVSAPPVEQKTAMQSFIDFLFTIPGAITIVVCAVGLFVLNAFFQKSKQGKLEKEEQKQP